MTSDTVRIAIITVVGSVAVALITTLGTIKASSNGISDNQQRLSQLQQQITELQSRANSLSKPGIPVGTIVASILTPQEFAKVAGDPSNLGLANSKWTLADGKDVAGTDYVEVTTKTSVPNLSGVFLRGQNHGRFSDLKEIDLGAYIADTVGPHTHIQAVANPSNLKGAGIKYDGGSFYTLSPASLVRDTGAGIGTETVPKNATVNFYIRINK